MVITMTSPDAVVNCDDPVRGDRPAVAYLDPTPTGRASDPEPVIPDTVDEALALLDDAHQAGDGYPDDLVAHLVALLTTGSDPAAVAERARYAAWLEDTARGGRDLTDGARAGLRQAAGHLRANRAGASGVAS